MTTPPTRTTDSHYVLARPTGKKSVDRYTTDRSGSLDRRSGSAGRTQRWRWHQVTSPHMKPDMWGFQRMQMIHLHILGMPAQSTRNLLRMLAAHMTHMRTHKLTHRRMIQHCSSHWMRNRDHSSRLNSRTPSPLLPRPHPNQLHIAANNPRPSCCPSQGGPSRRQAGCPGQAARSDSRHAQIVRLHRHARHRPHQCHLHALHRPHQSHPRAPPPPPPPRRASAVSIAIAVTNADAITAAPMCLSLGMETSCCRSSPKTAHLDDNRTVDHASYVHAPMFMRSLVMSLTCLSTRWDRT